ncbi:acyltransferase family protein [Chitinimonas sp.]|uniref:acyltransferase family protein n=1 Tax=Chitinimonas sp. TaxID=1934313 RepID=UPI002F91F67B
MDTRPDTRRHDIDALRIIAFGLLILYHTGMVYVADWGYHIKSPYTAEWLQLPMLFMNRWRMDLIFLLSGVATAFLLRNNTAWRFVRQRSWRLLLPLTFGMLVVVPVQPYVQGVSNGLVAPGFGQFLLDYYSGHAWPAGAFDGWEHGFTWNHLWYIAYLWCYSLLLPLLRPLLDRLQALVDRLRSWSLLALPALPLLFYCWALKRDYPETHALLDDWYNHAMYFSIFVYGYWLGRSATLWAELLRLRKPAVAAALLLFGAYYAMLTWVPENPPEWMLLLAWLLRSLYVWCMLAAILGWAYALLNKPFAWLRWGKESVYPWYVLHQSLIILIAYWLLPYHLGPLLEPLLVIGGTVLGCWLLNDGLLRRVACLRACFGLAPLRRSLPAGRCAGQEAATA